MLANTKKRALLWAVLLVAGFALGIALWEGEPAAGGNPFRGEPAVRVA